MLTLLRHQGQQKGSVGALALLLPALCCLCVCQGKPEDSTSAARFLPEAPSETGRSQKLVWRAWNHPLSHNVPGTHRTSKGKEVCRVKALVSLTPKPLLQLEFHWFWSAALLAHVLRKLENTPDLLPTQFSFVFLNMQMCYILSIVFFSVK